MSLKTANAAPQLLNFPAESMEAAQVDKDYAQARQTFQEKVKSPKAEKALLKDTGMGKAEHLAKLQRDHMQTMAKITEADRAKADAQGAAGSDPATNQVMKQGADDSLLSNLTKTLGPQAPGLQNSRIAAPKSAIRSNGLNNSLASSFLRGRSSGVGSGSDLGSLTKALGQKRTESADLRSQMEGMGSQQNDLLGMGQKQMQTAGQFGNLKDLFSSQAASNQALQGAYGDAGKGLKSASQGLGNAAQVIKGVAQALGSASAAVMPIPFVGPALAAKLKAAATVVGTVGKVLQVASAQTGQSGVKMDGKAAVEGKKLDLNRARTAENQAKELQAKDEAKRTQTQLDQTSGSKDQARAELRSNANEQRELAQKIAQKGGGPTAIDQADQAGAERPNLDLKTKAPVQAKAAGKGTAAPAIAKAPAAPAKPVSAPANESKAEKPAAPAQAPAQAPKGQVAKVGAQSPQGKNDPSQRAQGIRGGEGGEQLVAGQNSERQSYESQLKQLSSKVQSAGKGAGSQDRKSAQQELASVYRQAAAGQVAVSAEVEGQARQALEGSSEQIGTKLTIAPGASATTGASGGSSARTVSGASRGLEIPKLSAPNFMAIAPAQRRVS